MAEQARRPLKRDAEEVEALFERGAAAWPRLALASNDFHAFVASRLGKGALRAEDLFLVCACVRRVPGAEQAFDARYMREVARALEERASPALVADVQQKLRELFFFPSSGTPSRLEKYGGTGSLRGWVRAVAARTAASLLRMGHKGEVLVSAGGIAHVPHVQSDPELDAIRARYRPEFDAAFAAALNQLTPRERNVLRLHLVEGLNIEQIGKAYRVHRATVARWIAAARDTIVGETQRGLGERLSVSPAELRSLLGALRSQLELSMDGFLKASLG